MVIGKTRNLTVIIGGAAGRPEIERTAYPQGAPKKAGESSFEKVGKAPAFLAKNVGKRASFPLTRREKDEISKDLEPLSRGINLYKNLPADARDDISMKQFAVMNAMLEAIRKA